MPENAYQAVDVIVDALISGKIPMERLENSLERKRRAISKIESLDNSSDSAIIQSQKVVDNSVSLLSEKLID